MADELGLDVSQRVAQQEAFQRREGEVEAVRTESAAGALGMEAYFDRVHGANERFYDAMEARLGTEQRVLLRRYREQSRSGVDTLRAEARKTNTSVNR